MSRRPRPTPEALAAGVVGGDRVALAQAITLCESERDDDQPAAQALLAAIYPRTGGARRIGITGVPGVGKSTCIERLGLELLARGHRVAVLAVDPSSQRTGGSILGDKTRMDGLAADDRAYVRPSPSGGTLGGVHRKTREALLLCEAAGFDVVLVETVGIGQSETAVAAMVDTFCVLMLPGAGDELQGIKRGVLELADVLLVHKADGERLGLARQAARDLVAAVRVFGARDDGWRPEVLLASSALTATPDAAGADPEVADAAAIWQALERHREHLLASQRLTTLRAAQQVAWFWALVEQATLRRLRRHPACAALGAQLESAVSEGSLPASVAAARLLAAVDAAG